MSDDQTQLIEVDLIQTVVRFTNEISSILCSVEISIEQWVEGADGDNDIPLSELQKLDLATQLQDDLNRMLSFYAANSAPEAVRLMVNVKDSYAQLRIARSRKLMDNILTKDTQKPESRMERQVQQDGYVDLF